MSEARPRPVLRSIQIIGALIVLAGIWLGTPYAYISYRDHFGLESYDFPGHAYGADGVLRISNDPGGNALDRAAHARILARQGVQVRVLGMCASACTRYLAVPDLCTAPTALWLFHRAYMSDRDAADLSLLQRTLLSRITTASYADVASPLRSWALDVTRAMHANDQHVMTGQTLIDAGWARACAEPGTHPDAAQAERSAKMLSHGAPPMRPLPVRAVP